MYQLFIKRIFDFSSAFFGLIVLSPVFITVYLILLITNKSNPFFYQKRPGLNEHIFRIIKFKSMTDKKDAEGNLLPDTERVTKFGNFIRKTSLDEIPQLINVLKGDMSLVGPRPFLPIYLPYYTKTEKKRHQVRPGITGYAQVNGRNYLEWDKKLEYDVYYVENLTWQLDFKILLKTANRVLSSSDVSVDLNEIQAPLHIVRDKNI
ncbi:sugar transferase [Tamlana sp. 2_MG-2023]|uniref:sugar transferase n=1 Tax=unclassified Tamlana TaxID=2614803 RepID=UPI0026E269D8|nr:MULTISPECIES: sugar transferase [unclassified Tamlana]MDO6759411.1 sugar transferase [Tamlana sp. 2_MG-2023]MDO6790450.1 sugar transferase [Tamlana sp. 1_MG-2023]